MGEHPIENLMNTAMNSIKDMIDVNTIIGEPIQASNNTVIIPISKVGFGFAAGGSEFRGETIDEYTKKEKEEQVQYRLPFGGGSGAGVNITPVAFLVVQPNTVKLLPVDHSSCLDRLLDYVPDLIEKVNSMLNKQMQNKKPPFTITEKILTDVMEICGLVGKVSSTQHLSSDPVLRRQNRIKTIYSSLAIEQNTLSLEQVTAVLSGKRVLAPPKDIMEVKNAYEIYDHLNELNPYSVEDLLLAHHVMMRGLVQEDGVFRSKPVGVVDSHGNVLHFGTLPQYVPPLVEELLKWTEDSPLPMLIKSCVFHYEFEVIHPFADGNGRIGRLWHTLLLSRWNPLFAWLPVESIVHDHQQEYYEAINTSNAQGEGTAFIEFMLSVIEEALLSVIPENFEKSMMPTSGKENRWNILEKYLKKEKIIHNSDVQQLLEVSSATANRILVSFVKEGKLERVRDGRYWAYQKL